MVVLKCKVCGSNLNITPNEQITKCEFCGTEQTVPEDNIKESKTQQTSDKIRVIFLLTTVLFIFTIFAAAMRIYTNKNEKFIESQIVEVTTSENNSVLDNYIGTWFATTVDEAHNFDMFKYNNTKTDDISIYGIMLEIKKSSLGYYAYLSTNLQPNSWFTKKHFNGEFALPIKENDEHCWSIEYNAEDSRTNNLLGSSTLTLTINIEEKLFVEVNGAEQSPRTPLYNIDVWQNGKYKYYNQDQSEIRMGSDIEGYNTPIDCEIFLRENFYTKWTTGSTGFMPGNIYVVKYTCNYYRGTVQDLYFYNEWDLNTLHHARFYGNGDEMILDDVTYTDFWSEY